MAAFIVAGSIWPRCSQLPWTTVPACYLQEQTEQHLNSKEGQKHSLQEATTAAEKICFVWMPCAQLFWLIRPLLRLQIYLYDNKITLPAACCVCCIACWCVFIFLDVKFWSFPSCRSLFAQTDDAHSGLCLSVASKLSRAVWAAFNLNFCAISCDWLHTAQHVQTTWKYSEKFGVGVQILLFAYLLRWNVFSLTRRGFSWSLHLLKMNEKVLQMALKRQFRFLSAVSVQQMQRGL